MSNSTRLLIALVTVLAAAPAMAAEQAPLRIAAVDLATLMEQSPFAVEVSERLRSEFGPRQQELTAMQQELQAMDTRLNTQGEFMSETDRVALERELARQGRQFQLRTTEYQEDANRRNGEEVQRLQNIIVQAVRDYAEAQGFDLVLADGIVYHAARIDITQGVMELIRERYRARGAAPAGG